MKHINANLKISMYSIMVCGYFGISYVDYCTFVFNFIKNARSLLQVHTMSCLQEEVVQKDMQHIGTDICIKEELTDDEPDIKSTVKNGYVLTELLSEPSDVNVIIKEEVMEELLQERLEPKVFCTNTPKIFWATLNIIYFSHHFIDDGAL